MPLRLLANHIALSVYMAQNTTLQICQFGFVGRIYMIKSRIPLRKFVKEYSVRNKLNEDIPVYSVTNSQGFCTEYFSKEVASQDKTTYKIVPRGYFAYNPSRINVGSVDWQKYEDRVIVSPLYNVFSVSDEIDCQYLYYFFRSNIGRQMIKAKSSGSVRDNLKIEMLKEMTIPDISMREQQFCSSVLDKLQILIKLKFDEIKQMDELVKARFVEMFGKRKYTKLKWNDVFYTKTGKLDSNAATSNGQYPFFTCSKDILRIDNYAFDQEALLLSGNNASGKYDVKYYNGKFNAYQRTYVLGLKEQWSYNLMKYQLEEKLMYLKRHSLGGLTKYLTLKILSELSFIIPPMEKQVEFDSFVRQADKSKLPNTSIIYTLFVGMAYTLPGTLALYLCAKLSPVNGDMGVPFQVRSRYFSRLAVLKLS